jgi:hypothetical protein
MSTVWRVQVVGDSPVRRIHRGQLKALPERWMVERDPIVTEEFIWASHSRDLLRRVAKRVIALGKQSRQSLRVIHLTGL